MAEPIRSYTPRRDVREELRRKVEDAPMEHAQAVLSAYELLQEAQDHGVLDTLRGLIGAGDTLIGKASEYANTPEGIRLMRNGLAAVRLLGEIDPAILDSAAKAMSRSRDDRRGEGKPPSMIRILQRFTSQDSRRTLNFIAGFTEFFGQSQDDSDEAIGINKPRIPAIVPVIAIAAVAVFVSFKIGRNR